MVPPHVDSLPVRFTISQNFLGTMMSSDDQKRFGRFIHLAPSKFSGVIGENAYEFLIDCQEKLHNLGSLESHGVSYTTFQLTNVAKDW